MTNISYLEAHKAIRLLVDLERNATPLPWVAELDMFDNNEIEALVTNTDGPLSAFFTSPTGIRNIRDKQFDESKRWTKEDQEYSQAAWDEANKGIALANAKLIVAARKLFRPLLDSVYTTLTTTYGTVGTIPKDAPVFKLLEPMVKYLDATVKNWRNL